MTRNINVRQYSAVGAECGSVYRIKNRRADVLITRKLSGGIGKTKELAGSHTCGLDSYYEAEIADGLYIGLCKQHAKALGVK